MRTEPPTWPTWLSWAVLVVAALSAADVLLDLYGRRRRQQMPVMEAVWPVTALYFGPVASVAYRRWGRPQSRRGLREQGLDEAPDRPRWTSVALGVSHSGGLHARRHHRRVGGLRPSACTSPGRRCWRSTRATSCSRWASASPSSTSRSPRCAAWNGARAWCRQRRPTSCR